MIKEIIYKLFRVEPFPCASCETLRSQLEFVNYEKKELLNLILEKNKPEVKEVVERPQPIPPKTIPWNVKQRMLEQEDRAKAQILRQHTKSVEELEKGIIPNTAVSGTSNAARAEEN